MPIGSKPERNVGLQLFFDREQHLITPHISFASEERLFLGHHLIVPSLHLRGMSRFFVIFVSPSQTKDCQMIIHIEKDHNIMNTMIKVTISIVELTCAHLSFPCSPSERQQLPLRPRSQNTKPPPSPPHCFTQRSIRSSSLERQIQFNI